MSALPIDPSEVYLPDYREIRRRLAAPAEALQRQKEEARRQQEAALEAAIAAAKERREAALEAAERAKEIWAQQLKAASEISRPTVRAIIDRVAAKHGLLPADLIGFGRRTPFVAKARQEAMYEARLVRPDKGFTAIGRDFGADHSTVQHGVKAHAARYGLELPHARHPDPFAARRCR